MYPRLLFFSKLCLFQKIVLPYSWLLHLWHIFPICRIWRWGIPYCLDFCCARTSAFLDFFLAFIVHRGVVTCFYYNFGIVWTQNYLSTSVSWSSPWVYTTRKNLGFIQTSAFGPFFFFSFLYLAFCNFSSLHENLTARIWQRHLLAVTVFKADITCFNRMMFAYNN